MGKLEPATFESLEHLGHRMVSQLRQRLELLALEVTEEEIRFARVLSWLLVALFLSCLAFMLCVGLVVAAFWDTGFRIVALSWMLGLTAGAAGLMWWLYRQHMQRKPIIFAQTVEELRRDAEALKPQAAPGAAFDGVPTDRFDGVP